MSIIDTLTSAYDTESERIVAILNEYEFSAIAACPRVRRLSICITAGDCDGLPALGARYCNCNWLCHSLIICLLVNNKWYDNSFSIAPEFNTDQKVKILKCYFTLCM